MADSITTRTALINALRGSLKSKPISKIGIGELTDICNMNRKSFYYHFHDRDELMIWALDYECLSEIKKNPSLTPWGILSRFSKHIGDCMEYYHTVFTSPDTEKFTEHMICAMRELLAASIKANTHALPEESPAAARITDHIIFDLTEWIKKEPEKSASDFLAGFKSALTAAIPVISSFQFWSHEDILRQI